MRSPPRSAAPAATDQRPCPPALHPFHLAVPRRCRPLAALADDLPRPRCPAPAEHRRLHPLQRLVAAEEVLDLAQPVGREIGQLVHLLEARITARDAEDLL